jgi:hypothetical protein
MTALSDHLPALSAQSARTLWLPEQVAARAHDAESSMAVSYSGEAFLYGSAAEILVHLGPGAAERALDYVYGRQGSQVLLFHPSPYVRSEQRSYYEALHEVRVLQSLSELAAFEGKLVNVYMDESCFDLAMVEEIAAHTTIDWLVGAFESLRYPTSGIYQRLKLLVRNFRLRDASLHTLIHAGHRDTVDVSLILPASDALTLLDLPRQTDTTTFEVILIATDIDPKIRNQLQARGTERLRIVFAEATTTADAITRAYSLASGRYLAFIAQPDETTLGLTARLFEAAIIGNADLAVVGSEEGKEHLVVGVQRSTAASLTTEPLARPALFRRAFLEFHNIALESGELATSAQILLGVGLLYNPDTVLQSAKGLTLTTPNLPCPDLAALTEALSRTAQQVGTRFCEASCLRIILSEMLASRAHFDNLNNPAFDLEASHLLRTFPDRITSCTSLLEELPERLRLYAQALLTGPANGSCLVEQAGA